MDNAHNALRFGISKFQKHTAGQWTACKDFVNTRLCISTGARPNARWPEQLLEKFSAVLYVVSYYWPSGNPQAGPHFIYDSWSTLGIPVRGASSTILKPT